MSCSEALPRPEFEHIIAEDPHYWREHHVSIPQEIAPMCARPCSKHSPVLVFHPWANPNDCRRNDRAAFGQDPSKVECSTNCYLYALNDRGPLPYGTKLQPGQISGYQMTMADVNVDRIIELAMADAQVGGHLFQEVTRDEACQQGSYKIALVVDPMYPDYHWYRQNPDGSWSAKSGLTPVTNLDASDQPIWDPAAANRDYRPRGWNLNYTQFGGTSV